MKRGALYSRLGGALDGIVLSALGFRFQKRRSGARAPHAPDAVDRRALLAEAISFYGGLGGDAFFPAPEAPRVYEEKRGTLPGGEIVDVKWASPYEPAWPLQRADYLSHAPNRFGHARVLRHFAAAPSIVCLHGYRGGSYFVSERAFVARWLYGLGLNVALFTLPFHGARGGDGAPVWPSVNVARTNEGFGHAIYDLRAFMGWLRQNAAPVALCGMSLGGYTTALAATVEPLPLGMAMIPVASFPDLLWAHGEGKPERARAERDGITLGMLRAAMAVHGPLERAPRTPPDRFVVVSADGDRIAPPEHAERLARHFGAEELRLAGGHVLQRGRGDGFRALARRLSALGIIQRQRD